jgi:hypothetical protein
MSKFRPPRGDRRSLRGDLRKPREQRIDERLECIDRRRRTGPAWIESPTICRQVQRLHDLGARAVLELLAAAAHGADIAALLADYGRLNPDVWTFEMPPHGPIAVPDDLRETRS